MFASHVSSALSSLADCTWLAFQPISVAIPLVLPFAGSSDDDDDNAIESNQGLSNNNTQAGIPVPPCDNLPVAQDPGHILPPAFLEIDSWLALLDTLSCNNSYGITIDNKIPSCFFAIGVNNLLSGINPVDRSLDAICNY